MPLTTKGRKILRNLTSEYGEKRGRSVLYAMRNAGRVTGVDSVSGVTGLEEGSGVGAESWVNGKKNSTGYQISAADRVARFADSVRRPRKLAAVRDAVRRGLSAADALAEEVALVPAIGPSTKLLPASKPGDLPMGEGVMIGDALRRFRDGIKKRLQGDDWSPEARAAAAKARKKQSTVVYHKGSNQDRGAAGSAFANFTRSGHVSHEQAESAVTKRGGSGVAALYHHLEGETPTERHLVHRATDRKTVDEHEGFKKLEGQLAHEKGIRDPAGLAAAIGRKKLGKGKFQRRATRACAGDDDLPGGQEDGSTDYGAGTT